MTTRITNGSRESGPVSPARARRVEKRRPDVAPKILPVRKADRLVPLSVTRGQESPRAACADHLDLWDAPSADLWLMSRICDSCPFAVLCRARVTAPAASPN